ncbi:MAG: hypothetical protein CVU39_04810 [Chloroflexi bacterium HGW-Chloroflexi-10]|nr:MAG: hypothetical protein CVU39_04810 [Chloroflexi bacterium HGW-Chloroflexi-10]
MTEQNSTNYRHDRHRSIFFPILLIMLGVFFLLSNMNMIPGDAWSLVVRFWPVVFLIGAIEDLINFKWVGAVFNTGIGVVLLLANLGYFPWTAWQMIFRLWPLLIIAWGLDIAFRGQSIVGSLIGISISVVIVGGLVWFALQGPLTGVGETTKLTYAIDGVREGHLYFQPSVGKLSIESFQSKTELVRGEVTLAEEENFEEKFDVRNGSAELSLSSRGIVVLPSRQIDNGFPWNLEINDQVPFTMEVEQGVGKQELELNGLNISDLNITLGVGSVEVTLPVEEFFEGQIECAVGEIIVRIPENLAVKIELDTAISSLSLSSGLSKDGDWVYSPAGLKSKNPSVLKISNPIGQVRIVLEK